MKISIPVTLLGVFLLYPFLGCNTEVSGGSDDPAAGITAGNSGGPGAYTAVAVVPVIPKGLQEPDDANPAAVSVAAGANDFAFRLSANLAAQTGAARNMVCSPLSVWIPLTALTNAVDAAHKPALLSALGAAGMGGADINAAASRMLYDLTRQQDKDYTEKGWLQGYHEPIKIANAIFVDYRVTLNDDFAQTFMDYYRGSSLLVNFSAPAAVAEVNDWVNKNTQGMIRNIIAQFGPATTAVLANAIYYFDQWIWKFDPSETTEDIFYALGGERAASYMLREGEQRHFEDERLQAVSLDFTAGGGLAILLPKDGDAAGLLESLTNDYFRTIQNGSTAAQGRLLLPRFSIEGDVLRLQDILTAMGIPLFSTGSLTGLIKGDAVHLSDAIHKAVITVDEKGTTAAAVTILPIDVMWPGPEPLGKPFEMICNKPFVFILHDYTNDGGTQVVFTGMVNQP
ncbi:MAG: serpin family protein [Treponema sp.]|nr:serpin family protein [Treponema sp.]